MKNIKLLLAIALCLNTAAAISTSVLQVSSSTAGMIPGKTGIITLSFFNAGSDIAYDTKVVLKSLDSPLTSTSLCNECISYSNSRKVCYEYKDYCYRRIGDIYGSNIQQASYKIAVPENIESGNYVASFEVQYASKNTTTGAAETRYIDKQVVLVINNSDVRPKVEVKSITMPDVISPGDIFNVSIALENNGETNAKDVKTKLTTTFKTIGSTNEKLAGEINKGNVKVVNYTLAADPSVSPGVYELGVGITYSDNEKSYSSSGNAGIIVDGNTSFNIFIQGISPESIIKDQTLTALISVANTGIINAKSVSIKLNKSPNIITGNVNQDFLGDLDAGDFTTTNFKFTPKSEGEVILNLSVSYLTPSGKKVRFSSPQRVIIRYAAQKEEKKDFSWLVWIAALLIGITYFYIRRKRK